MSRTLNLNNQEEYKPRPSLKVGVNKCNLVSVTFDNDNVWLDFEFKSVEDESYGSFRVFSPNEEFIKKDKRIGKPLNYNMPSIDKKKGEIFTEEDARITTENKTIQLLLHIINKFYSDEEKKKFKLEAKDFSSLFKKVIKLFKEGNTIEDKKYSEIVVYVLATSKNGFIGIKRYPQFIARTEEELENLKSIEKREVSKADLETLTSNDSYSDEDDEDLPFTTED